jgi:hypothetical protein
MAPQLFDTPILFLIFNRPGTTERVFQTIRAIRPRQLFVSADGPRLSKKNEQLQCEETRSIIRNIDWDCTLKTNFSEKNLGCRVAVSSAIDWFFANVNEGIILEDDCLPDQSFFPFCESLLQKYRRDLRIMHINGVNCQDGVLRGNGSYYFSGLSHVWGWATWKRAWDAYDVNIATYPEFLATNMLQDMFPLQAMQRYWRKRFDLVFNRLKDTWDFQWQYSLSINNGLCITPNVNLVSNIGFNLNATHTIDNFHSLANRPTSSLASIVHPPFVSADHAADRYEFRKYVEPHKFKKLWQLIRRSLQRVYPT